MRRTPARGGRLAEGAGGRGVAPHEVAVVEGVDEVVGDVAAVERRGQASSGRRRRRATGVPGPA